MGKILLLSVLLASLLSACTMPSSDPQNHSQSNIVKEIAAPTYGTGTHTLEYFGDYQCPACIRFVDTILPVFEDLAASGKLTIVYKQFPLTNIHKNAYRDALAALCAAEQGQYIPYKKSLYALEKSKNGATVTDADRVALTKDITGIKADLFSQCLSEERYKTSVDRDIAEGDAKRVNATPTVILDGLKLDMSLFRDADDLRTRMTTILER